MAVGEDKGARSSSIIIVGPLPYLEYIRNTYISCTFQHKFLKNKNKNKKSIKNLIKKEIFHVLVKMLLLRLGMLCLQSYI